MPRIFSASSSLKTKFLYLHISGTLDADQALLSSAGGDLSKIESVTLSDVTEQQF